MPTEPHCLVCYTPIRGHLVIAIHVFIELNEAPIAGYAHAFHYGKIGE